MRSGTWPTTWSSGRCEVAIVSGVPQRDGKDLVTNTPRQTLKILHTADVHLDLDGYVADPQGQRYRDIVHQAFSTVIDLAIQESVDLLLIAGDLFDSNRPGGDVVDFAIQELRRAERPIVVLPGNHDCLNMPDFSVRHPKRPFKRASG
jgi:DNA repair protein SbcD/Mre11